MSFESFVPLCVAPKAHREGERSPRRSPAESLLGASLAAVNAAASKYAAPAGTTLLLVGDRSKIEAGLKDNAGAVVVLDVEGRRVK